MQKTYLYTRLKARLKLIRTTSYGNANWIFLPGDGSNLTQDDTEAFSHWSEALLEAVSALDNVILAAHSTGGMFALATPGLEKTLSGLILMDSAPDASWQKAFMAYIQKHPLGAHITDLQQIYEKNPSNDNLKKFTVACAPWFSTDGESLQKNISLFQNLPYNFKMYEWSAKHFDQSYTAKWIPLHIPALIFAGDNDRITPLRLFVESKKFDRPNIMISEIKNSSHFPWHENPAEVIKLFQSYCQNLTKISYAL